MSRVVLRADDEATLQLGCSRHPNKRYMFPDHPCLGKALSWNFNPMASKLRRLCTEAAHKSIPCSSEAIPPPTSAEAHLSSPLNPAVPMNSCLACILLPVSATLLQAWKGRGAEACTISCIWPSCAAVSSLQYTGRLLTPIKLDTYERSKGH